MHHIVLRDNDSVTVPYCRSGGMHLDASLISVECFCECLNLNTVGSTTIQCDLGGNLNINHHQQVLHENVPIPDVLPIDKNGYWVIWLSFRIMCN